MPPGKLSARKLVSLWNLPELRRIDVSDAEVSIGAGCTYTDLREHEIVEREFPLLASAARWTGGIANQNRGTLGGNIVNASPAADSLPALLVYEAELILVSARGERRVRYVDFHTGYKKTLLAADELIRAVVLPRRFAGYISYSRKVGARNAQAISKVCVAALGRVASGVVEDVRIAVGSVAPVPLRLRETERVVKGERDRCRAGAAGTGRPQCARSVRSTTFDRRLRIARPWSGNLVAEFLHRLAGRGKANERSAGALEPALPRGGGAGDSACCGSAAWAQRVGGTQAVQRRVSL